MQLLAVMQEPSLILVMEYMPLGTLSAFLSEKKGEGPEGVLSWRQTQRIATDILKGLAHLHARAFIHRDIKPSNILLHGDLPLPHAKIGGTYPPSPFILSRFLLIILYQNLAQLHRLCPHPQQWER